MLLVCGCLPVSVDYVVEIKTLDSKQDGQNCHELKKILVNVKHHPVTSSIFLPLWMGLSFFLPQHQAYMVPGG